MGTLTDAQILAGLDFEPSDETARPCEGGSCVTRPPATWRAITHNTCGCTITIDVCDPCRRSHRRWEKGVKKRVKAGMSGLICEGCGGPTGWVKTIFTPLTEETR